MFQKSFHNRFHRLRILTLVVIAGLLLAAAIWTPSQTPLAQLWSRVGSAHAASVQTDPITAAWEQVKATGSYHFSSDVTQTTTPSASVRNVGRRSQTDQIYLEGMADIDATAMEFRLWSGGGSLLQDGSSLSARVADGKTYTRQNGGDWQEATDFTQSLAPAGDFMSYLVAARGITDLGEETRAGLTFTRYAFTLDGPTFARSVQQQMEEAMRLKGDVPEGISFAVPAHYSNMTGHGELWVGQDGLPVRQLLALQFPENKGEAVSAHITVNFSRFGYARSATLSGTAASAGNTSAPIAALLAFLNTTAKNLPGYLAFVTALSLAILLLSIVFYSRRVRRIQQALSLALILSFVVGPVFNAMRMTRFFDAQTAQAKAQEDKQAESKLARDARSSASAPAFNPHQNPLAAAPAEAAFSRPLAGLAAPVAAPALQATTALTTPNGVDSDLDGLTDFAEQRVGTDPASNDTDGDLLLDKQEVDGFTYGGKNWYANPNEVDSNKDGIGDTIEWDPSGNGGLPDDTDGDGVPDLFDEDNDGDGVPDDLDLAPFVKGTVTYGRNAPLMLQVQNLNVKSTFVDFQLRPINQDFLWFSRNMLDWPQDDQGQFRDIDNQPADMTLVPMLEITIPDAANMVPPTAALEPYAINVSQMNNGTQIAYVPLSLVTDEKSGARVAFNGRMRYFPKAAWTAAHTVRLVWVVQMENDRLCAPGSAGYDANTGYCLNQPQIIHRYYEDWTLTGLNVTEQHGAEFAVIYEDPAASGAPDNDDGAMALLAYTLEKRFLNAQKVGNSPAVRALTFNNLRQRFDRVVNDANGGMPYGLPDIFRVTTIKHDTFDEAIKESGKALSGVLDSVFATHWTNNRSIKPLLTTSYEQKSRALSLDSARLNKGYAGFSGAALTLNLSPAGQENVPLTTMVGMKWTPFCGGNGTTPAWEACAADAYWLEIGARLASSVNLDPNNPSQIVNTLDTDIVTGQTVASQLLVFALMQGINTVIQQEFSPTDNRILANPAGQESDQAVADQVRAGLTVGNAGIKFIANLYFIAYATAPTKGFVALSKYVFSSNKQIVAEALVEVADDLIATKPLTTIGVVVFAAAVVTMVTLMVLAAEGNEKAEIGLSVMLTGVSIGLSVGLPIYATIQAARTATSIPQLLLGRSELIGASRGAAMVGAALAIGVTWGFFLYSVASNNVSAFSPEFNAALAQTIAATIYILILTVLSLTVAGLILVGILTGIDAVLSLVCELKNKENCFTIGGAATKAIATAIYAYDLMVDPARADLIKTGSPTYGLANPDGGYVTNATVAITLPLTTTIVHKDPEPKNSFKIAPYLWLYNKDNLRSTTFNYSLTSPDSETLSAKRGVRPGDWAAPTEDHKYIASPLFRTHKVDNVGMKSGLQFAQPGLNRSAPMYLNMAYALPAIECWVLPVGPLLVTPVCYDRAFDGGLSNQIDSLYFDILPDSLAGFVSLAERQGNNFAQAWDNKFTALTDADGDGLLSNASGGLDLNDSTWDSDKDGLSDAFEIEQRAAGWPYSPGQCDTDNDGLTDKQEAAIGSNPGIADSDNDGLLDREEVWHQEYVNCQPSANWSGGWNITINETTPFTIRVTSDPTANDSDQDGLSDLAEKQLAQNSNPALRVDKQNRPWHPAIANVSPIEVLVDVNDLDRFVGVGQKLVYTTTATTSVAVEPSVLDVNAPAEVGGPKPPAFLPFNPSSFSTEQTVSSQTAFTVSSGTNRQQLDFTSSVRARLQSSSPAPFAWEFAKADLSGIPAQPVHSQAIVPFGRDRQDSYQIPILTSDSTAQGGNGEMRYHLVPANTLGVIPTGGGLKMGLAPPDIACNNAQNCLIVREATTTDRAFSVVQVSEIDAAGFFVDAVQFNHGPNLQYQPVIASDGTNFAIAYHTTNGIRFEIWGHQFTTPFSTTTVNLPAGQTIVSVRKDLIWMGDRYRLAVKYRIGGLDDEIALYDFSPAGVLVNTALPVQFQQGSLNNVNFSSLAGPALAYDPAHGEALLVYQSIELKTRRVRLPKNINSNTNWSAFNTYLYLPDSSTTFNSERFDVTYDQRFDKWLINLNGYLTYLSASAVRGNEGTLSPFLTVEPLNKVALACPAASSLPVGDFRFEDFPGAAAFSNAAPGTLPDGTSPKATCSAGTCPSAGLPGATDSLNNAVGKPASDYSLRFDGMDDQIALPNAPNTPYTLGSEFSIAFWYKADGTATPFTTFYVQGSGNAPGFALNINSATLEFWAGTVASKISAPHSMNDGKWHFVTATRQGNGGLALYVDGASKAAGVGSTAPVMPATLIVGGGHRAIGLDDLKLYNAALSGTTVQDLYKRTDQAYCVGVANNKWSKLNISQPDPRGGKITASGGISLTVDTDKPTSSLSGLVNGQFVKGLSTYIIGGNASDPTSGVSKVEVSINNALQYVAASGAESWAYNLAVIEGEYNVRVRATDAVGNLEIPAAPIQIFADLTPPNVALNAIPATPILPTRNAAGLWTTRLTVTAQDRLSTGVRSGLPADGVEVRLDSDTEQGSWQTASRPNTNTTTWTIDYLFDAGLPDPTGTYTVNVRVVDNVGNRTNGATAILRLDATGPTAALSNQDAIRDVISNTLTLNGEVADTGTAGVDKVEMAFVTIEKIAALPNNISAAEADARLNRTWLPTTLAQRGAAVTRTTWSMAVPAGLEGIYQMDLRASDSLGNLRRSDNIWRGMVDLLAPRVTFTGTETGRRFFRGLTTLYEMRYVCRADDWQLNEATFECPNNAQQIPSRGFNNDPALLAQFPGLSLLNVMSNTYTLLQTSPQPVGSARACDSTGKCSTTTLAAAVQANALQNNRSVMAMQAPSTTTTPRAVILDPTEDSFVALAKGNDAVQVTLAGEANHGLKTIELFVDDALQTTIEFAEADAVKSVIRTVSIATPSSGPHVLTVKATDWAGNTQAELASTSVTILTGLPSVEIDSEFVVLTETYGLRSNMVILKGRVTTENLAAVKVKVNNGRWADARFADGRWEIAMPVKDLQSGKTLNVTVNAIDRFGQLKQLNMGEQVLLTEGGNPPDTVISNGPSGTTDALTATVSFSGTAGDRDIVGYECQVDEGGYAPCASGQVFGVTSNGEHTLRVRAIDAEGYVDPTPASVMWTVRSTQLEVTLTSAPASRSTSRTAAFGFEAAGASSFECALDGGEFATCSSPQAYSGLEDGLHEFLVRAVGGAATRYTWMVVNSVPVAADQAVTVASNDSVAITLSASDSDVLRYKVLSKPTQGALFGLAPNVTYVPNTGFVGEDRFTFKATDAENDSEVATVRIKVTEAVTQAKGKITIQVDAQPNSIQNFRFGGSLGEFRLDDAEPDDGDEMGQRQTFEVQPGGYVMTERVPASWSLTEIVCDDAASATTDLVQQQVEVNVVAGAHITCTFVNQRRVNFLLRTWEDANQDRRPTHDEAMLSGWKITIYDREADDLAILDVTTDANGQFDVLDTNVGKYKLCERLQAGWQNSHPAAFDETNTPCYWMTMPPGSEAELWYGNYRAASLGANASAPDAPAEIRQRPDVAFDEAGYEEVTRPVTKPTTVFLPLVAK